jgi:cytoskeletal protein RodZ
MGRRQTRRSRRSSGRNAPGPRTTAEQPQLGERLREQRLQRRLELADVAAQLELPSKSLRAVEWDRLDLLGSSDETDRVLRAYASFLDVDIGAAALDEAPENTATDQRSPPRKPVRGRSILLWIAVGAPLVIALAYVVGITLREAADGSSGDRQVTSTTRSTPRTIPNASAASKPRPRSKRRQAPRKAPARPPVRLVLAATRGDSWVEARAGSPTGSVLFSGTLTDGRKVRLSGRRLWIRFGAASNLVFTLNGRPAGEELQGTVETLVTPDGIRPA